MKFTVIVTETFMTRFQIEARTEQEARTEAVERAVARAWDGSEILRCERDAEVEP